MRVNLRRHALAAGLAGVLATLPLGAAGEKIDYEAINKIKEQGLQPQNSKVMEISSWLTDVYGPRLTGSPNTQKAGEWAVAKMKEWGLQNVALEKWPDQTMFPRGWANEKFYMAAVSPQVIPDSRHADRRGRPVPRVSCEARSILVTETTQEDVQKYAGKLKGKWILTQPAPDVPAYWTRTGDANDDRRTRANGTRDASGVPNSVWRHQQPRAAAAVRAARSPGGRGQGGAPPFNRNDFFRSGRARWASLSTAPRGHGIYMIGGSRATDPAQALPRNRHPCGAVRTDGADAREEPAGDDRGGHQEHVLSESGDVQRRR